ncbi:SIR2 family protein [Propionispira raffinosivorans]|uniref:SIR2 family protein n=1 Tax=Propionispira raffinosivorans TaxID=86959 RepID=UPI0003750BED|nr:SIR2 family protein [Propionispira raffinosivorans]
MDSNDACALLVGRMKSQRPVLVLGAGFSLGAKNKSGTSLLLGEKLAENLYNYFYIKHPLPEIDAEDLKEVEAIKGNLRKIATLLRSEGRGKIRDQHLKNILSGCYLNEKQDFQKKILSYPWKDIYTLNIDDLVEQIYKNENKPLNVWDRMEQGSNKNEEMKLVKLHGNVECIERGIVFDDEEYRKFTKKSDCLLLEFAHSFLNNDVIFLGTEFQEDDLKIIIEIYKESGYKNNGRKYFFITPKINDMALRNEIKNNKQYHLIDFTTEQFFNYIEKNVNYVENSKKELSQKGAFFIEDIEKYTTYSSKLYSGQECSYDDILNDWDVTNHSFQNQFEEFTNKNESKFFCIIGKDYMGKSVLAKRALVDCFKKGYISIELTKSFRNIDTVHEYLESLPEKSKVVFFMDDAAYNYINLKKIINNYPKNIEQVIIITTDTIENHRQKEYIINTIQDKFYVDNEFDKEIVYDKLFEKNRLGNYQKNGAFKENILKEISERTDIIDVLYYSTEGRYFLEYYKEEAIPKLKKTKFYDYVEIFFLLSILGVNWVPQELVIDFSDNALGDVTIDTLLEENNVFYEKNGLIKLCRRRIFEELIYTELNFERNINIIKNILNCMLPAISTDMDNSYYEINDNYYEIFQKILGVRKLLKKKIVEKNSLKNLFLEIENECKNISYYWVQYGILCQLSQEYEDANNHLLIAKNLRSNSYQVKHALAKNLMEWGLDETKNSDEVSSRFVSGFEKMEELILSEEYSNAFIYSVHAYVNMGLKYKKKNLDWFLSNREKMELYLNKLNVYGLDSKMQSLIKEYIRVCKLCTMTVSSKIINLSTYHIKDIYKNTDREY